MKRHLAIGAAFAAAAATAAFIVPATPASADPIVCLEFGGRDNALVSGGEACLPPAELDFLSLPFPTVFIPIPDFTSLLGSIPLPTIPLPDFPPTNPDPETTVVDDSSAPPAAAAAAATPFFAAVETPGFENMFDAANEAIASAGEALNDTINDVSDTTADANETVSGELNRTLNNALTNLNDTLNSVFGGASPETS